MIGSAPENQKPIGVAVKEANNAPKEEEIATTTRNVKEVLFVATTIVNGIGHYLQANGLMLLTVVMAKKVTGKISLSIA